MSTSVQTYNTISDEIRLVVNWIYKKVVQKFVARGERSKELPKMYQIFHGVDSNLWLINY